MKPAQTVNAVRAQLARFVDSRLVVAGLGIALLASCSTETQTAGTSPALGVYVQIDRVARPGVKEIFENYADHETSNRNSPATDSAISPAITSFMTAAANSSPNARGASSVDAAKISAVFIPDELQANLDGSAPAAAYLGLEASSNSFGGRSLTDPAMEIDLAAIYGTTFGTTAGSGSNQACLVTDNLASSAAPGAAFPYVQ